MFGLVFQKTYDEMVEVYEDDISALSAAKNRTCENYEKTLAEMSAMHRGFEQNVTHELVRLHQQIAAQIAMIDRADKFAQAVAKALVDAGLAQISDARDVPAEVVAAHDDVVTNP